MNPTAIAAAALIYRRRGDILVLFVSESTEDTPVYYASVVDYSMLATVLCFLNNEQRVLCGTCAWNFGDLTSRSLESVLLEVFNASLARRL